MSGTSRPNRIHAQMTLGVCMVVAVLASCSTRYTYVANSGDRTYFRMPKGWKVFDESELRASHALGISPTEQPGAAPMWIVAFDADPSASAKDLAFGDARYPQGLAQVRTIEDATRASFSDASIRNSLLPLDQLAQQSPGAVQLLDSAAIKQADGVHGMRLVYRLTAPGTSITVEQIGMVDSGTQKLHLLAIWCASTCYDRYRGSIAQVVDSWTVKEPR
jgi:hypothetical protein